MEKQNDTHLLEILDSIENPHLSLILPCYKEGKNLYKNISLIRKSLEENFGGKCYELILVNDGSPDNTDLKLQNLAKKQKNIRIISYPINQGKGNAVKVGVLQAKGDIVCFMDSDLDISPKFVVEYYHYLKNHKELDVVIGSKAVSNSERCVSLKRKVLSFVAKSINSILFGLPVKDTQVGIKMFRKKVAEDIFPLVSINGYAFDVEFLFHAHIHGYKIEERPVILRIEDRTSSVDFYSMLRILYDLFVLFKKTNYVYILRKKEIRFKTKIRIFILRMIIFPSERIVHFLLQVIKNPKTKQSQKVLIIKTQQV